MTTLIKSVHPSRVCRFTKPSAMDPRYLLCEIPGCSNSMFVRPKPSLSVVGSATSEEAAREIDGKREYLRIRVWQAIKKQGPVLVNATPFGVVGGLTDEEGIEETDIPASTYRPRRVELVESNHIVNSGQTRKTHSGRAAVVWTVRE